MRIKVLLLACALNAGCATVNQMAFDRASTSVDTVEKSIVLMTVDISRTDESRFALKPTVVAVERPGAETSDDRQNFILHPEDKVSAVDGREVYLVRMALKPGRHRIMQVAGTAYAFPLLPTFAVPLLGDIDVPSNEVMYVGRVTAVLRSRAEGEFRAGPLVPLIDQAVSGLSSGSFDVEILDYNATDIPLFRSSFPALKEASIASRPLPAFDRAAVQKWWDSDGRVIETAGPAESPPAVAPPTPSVSHPPLQSGTLAAAESATVVPDPTPSASAVAPDASLDPAAPAASKAVFTKGGKAVARVGALLRPRATAAGESSTALEPGSDVELLAPLKNPDGQWWYASAGEKRGWILEDEVIAKP